MTADAIGARAGRAGVVVGEELAVALADYLALLERWNARVNLTGLRSETERIDRLVVEPLVAAKHLGEDEEKAYVDIGSGGGSPAIPLCLACPELRARMVESRSRKAAFLREAASVLGLTDAKVECARFESLAVRREWAGVADVVTVRAVRLDESRMRLLHALTRPGGRLLLFGSAAGTEVLGVNGWSVRCRLPLVEWLDSGLTVLEPSHSG